MYDTYIYIYTYIHTYIHTYTHVSMYIYIYIHTCPPSGQGPSVAGVRPASQSRPWAASMIMIIVMIII